MFINLPVVLTDEGSPLSYANRYLGRVGKSAGIGNGNIQLRMLKLNPKVKNVRIIG